MHYRELESRPAVSLRKRTKPVDAAPQHRPPAAAVLALQRSHGNRYTQQVIARARRSPDDAGLDGATEAGLDSAIAQARGGGRQLDSSTRTLMEGAFGVDLSAVRAHTGPRAASLSRDLGARAFTTGQDIFFGHGEYDPGSTSGRELLAHELTHVLQQRGGVQLATGVSDPHDAAEQEANAIGRSIAYGAGIHAAPSVTKHTTAAVQRMSWYERNQLKESDYTSAFYNTKTNSGFYLFTIRHRSSRYHNIQVHWHPATENYPDENWTVRWANEGSGNNQPATEWMKTMVRKTDKGLEVALSSQGGGGTEYRAQFPSLTGD
jgi:uncharacterized protein DUF4157